MANYIETALRYDKVTENGLIKKVNERFLVDALSFTEAEARITEEMTPYIRGEYSVAAVKKTKISEVFFHEGKDYNYLVKVAFITIDEKTAVEKRTVSQILVQADNFKEAYDNFLNGMEGTMADYEIISISETPIQEVFKVKPATDEQA
ncbi:MAG: DUF4494 domain-containing protein [Bacteroides sp.]|nr:DUF4494 domain-containing protein [Bacteroides sp.]